MPATPKKNPSAPSTPKKQLAAPLTPTRSSRRIRGENPEIKIINLTESPSKSARKRALDPIEKQTTPKSGKKKKNVAVNLFNLDESTSTALEKSNREEPIDKTPSPKKKGKNVTADMFDESPLPIFEKSNQSLNESKRSSSKKKNNVTTDIFDESTSTALEKSSREEKMTPKSNLNALEKSICEEKLTPKNKKSPLNESVSTALEKSIREEKSTPRSKLIALEKSSPKKNLTVQPNELDESNEEEDLNEMGSDEEEEELSEDEPLTNFTKTNKSITFELSDSDDDPVMDKDDLNNGTNGKKASLNLSTKKNSTVNSSDSDSEIELDEELDDDFSDEEEPTSVKKSTLEVDDEDLSDEEEDPKTSAKHRKSVTFNLPKDKPDLGQDEFDEFEGCDDEPGKLNDEMEWYEDGMAEDGMDEDGLEDEDFEEEEELVEDHLPKKSSNGNQQTVFNTNQKNLQETIARYEQENLEPRSWELAGEVAAHEREQDGLLQQYIEVDYRATQAPVIDEDVDARIESIIKKRIKDKIFDDVVRTKRVDDSLQTYRARTTIDEIERKSLMQMYEDEYKKKSEAANETKENMDTSDNEEKLDAESDAIQREMNAIFSKLDALSHSNYRPSEIQGEPEVIVNKLALNLEEVGQKAATAPDEELLAPEEIVKRVKFVPKSKEERTKTDKLRERRHKKKKQKVIFRKMSNVKQAPKKAPRKE